MQQHHCGAGVQILEFLCQHFEQLLNTGMCYYLVSWDAHHELAFVDINRATMESVHTREEGSLVAVEWEG